MAAPTPLGDTAAVLLGAPGAVPSISGSWVVWTEPILFSRVIVAFNIETGETRRIAQATDLLDLPEIDGTTVVWVDGNADTAVNVVVGDVFGTEETVIGAGIAPDVSGSHVVFLRHVGADRLPILYNIETGEETVLATDVLVGNRPHIDGHRVVWDAGTSIFLYDIETKTTEIISPAEEHLHLQPDISGDWVVWQTGGARIDLFNVATHELRKLTDEEPIRRWFPVIDGNIVVWQDERNHRSEAEVRMDLFMYDILTGREVQLTGSANVPQPGMPPAVSSQRVVWGESIANTKLPNFSILMLELPQ